MPIDPSPSEPDVLMGFCHNGSVATPFMNSLLAAFAYDARRAQRRLVEYHPAMGPYIHDNRARIARYFLDHTDYQWLWMLDNDIEFPRDALYRLLAAAEEHQVMLLGAAYWNQYPGTRRALSWLMITEHDGIKAILDLPATDEPVPVTAVGCGCTLYHRDVLRDVAAMHPGDPWDTFGSDGIRLPNGRVERAGEDVTMCTRASRAGYQTYGLPTLVVEHYKTHRMDHGPSALALEDESLDDGVVVQAL